MATAAKAKKSSKTLSPKGVIGDKATARLQNQRALLERHGNFAEVMVRTTPEATDLINFARLWEQVMLEADRQRHGKDDAGKKAFEATRTDFEFCLATLAAKFADAAKRHNLTLEGDDFISRVAQRYGLGRTPEAVTATTKPAAAPAAKKATAPKKKVAASADDVE